MPIPYLRFSRAEIERLIPTCVQACGMGGFENIDIIILILDSNII